MAQRSIKWEGVQDPRELPVSMFPLPLPLSRASTVEMKQLMSRHRFVFRVSRESGEVIKVERTDDELRRRFGGLKRGKLMPKPDAITPLAPGVPPVKPKMVKVNVPDVSRVQSKYLRAILTQDEYALFIEKWNSLWKAHGAEWDAQYDFDDVYTMVFEHVQMQQMLLIRAKNPKLYSASEYQKSYDRLQKARENLDARKSSRSGGSGAKGNSSPTQFNLSILMNEPAKEAIEQRKPLVAQVENRVVRFLENTKTQTVDVEKLLGTPQVNQEDPDGSPDT